MKSQQKRPKKGIVEETRRIDVDQAVHIGARIVAVPIAGSQAAKRYALCPLCSCRVIYLYETNTPDGSRWSCRACANGGLTYRSRQERGTVKAFARWLTMRRWSKACALHPETEETYRRIEAARAANADDLQGWADEIDRLSRESGKRIYSDVYAFWCARNRSKPKRPKKQRAEELTAV